MISLLLEQELHLPLLLTVCWIDATRLKSAQVPPGGTLTGALSYRVPASLKEC